MADILESLHRICSKICSSSCYLYFTAGSTLCFIAVICSLQNLEDCENTAHQRHLVGGAALPLWLPRSKSLYVESSCLTSSPCFLLHSGPAKYEHWLKSAACSITLYVLHFSHPLAIKTGINRKGTDRDRGLLDRRKAKISPEFARILSGRGRLGLADRHGGGKILC